MKKRWKITLVVLSSLVIIAGIIVPLMPYILGWNPAYGTPAIEFPFENPEDITSISAYYTPDWGESGIFHNGIDLVINASSRIVSPCYGIVSRIWYNINPYAGGEVAMIHVAITINFAWSVKLVFEPNANTTELREEQLEAIEVNVGTKVEPGDFVGTLLSNEYYPHLHFMLMNSQGDVCPYHHSSSTAQAIYEDVAERTNCTICYES